MQFFDDQLQFNRLDFIKLSSYEEVKKLMSFGYAYAERTDSAGGFDDILGKNRKWIVRRALEYPINLLSSQGN